MLNDTFSRLFKTFRDSFKCHMFVTKYSIHIVFNVDCSLCWVVCFIVVFYLQAGGAARILFQAGREGTGVNNPPLLRQCLNVTSRCYESRGLND